MTINCNEHGVGMSKADGRVLLAFSCKDKEKPDLQLVKFTVKSGRVFLYATDGYKAVEAEGIAHEDAEDGEHLVRRDCLAQALKTLERNQVLRLCFEGASLNHARVEEQGLEVANVGWPEDAAIAQHGLPQVANAPNIKIPHASEQSARCVGVDEDAFKAVALMCRAAGKLADTYPPKTVDHPAIFCADGDTTWRASVRPKPTEESHGTRRRSKKQPTLPFAQANGASNGATNGAAKPEPVAASNGKARRPKAAKKAGKKSSKKARRLHSV